MRVQRVGSVSIAQLQPGLLKQVRSNHQALKQVRRSGKQSLKAGLLRVESLQTWKEISQQLEVEAVVALK